MREYSYYDAPKTVNALIFSEGTKSLTTGTIDFSIRVQNLVLKNSDFYKKCGFSLLLELTSVLPPDQPTVSTLIITNTADAQRLAIVKELIFTLVAVNLNKT